MPTVLFVRHGRSTSNTAGTLAGWMPGVFLDETGEAQAAAVGQRLAAAVLPVVEIVSSPLDRCVQTADLLAANHEIARRHFSMDALTRQLAALLDSAGWDNPPPGG